MEKKVIDLSKETGKIEILLPAIENTETVYGEKIVSGTPWTTKQPDKLVIFTKQDPFDLVPKSWEQFCEDYPNAREEYWIDGHQVAKHCINKRDELGQYEFYCKTFEDAEAFMSLVQLRRIWHEWVKVLGEPYQETYWEEDDDENTQMNWKITTSGAGEDGFPTYEATFQTKHCLLFREQSHAEKFIECFPELLEKAKILL